MLRSIAKFGFLNSHTRLISTAALMLFFYALFDGLLAYILPLKITNLGFSNSQMGLIIGSSSIFGFIFDFILASILTNTNYRRLFLAVFCLTFTYPLVLWSSNGIPLFMLSMAIWGLYADLNNYAVYDFVSRNSHLTDNCQKFGIISVFKSLGYLIAPILAGLLVSRAIDFFPFSLALSFVIISLIFYILLIQFSPRKNSPGYNYHPHYRHYNILTEFSLLAKIGKILLPVLLFSTTIYIFDAVFWTIGPIFSKSFTFINDFGGFFMTAYTLPILFIGWLVNPIVNKFGKKRTAFISFLLGALFLLPIGLISNPFIILLLVFISSIFNSFAWPAINGAYADYISESHLYSKEIESLSDIAYNIGYVVGPIMAGITADLVGIHNLFSVLAIFNIFAVLILLSTTPRHIKVIIHRD